MDNGLFDYNKAHEHTWAKELYGYADHLPEPDKCGVTSFVYLARLPYDPARIHELVNIDLPGVIRAKGHFRIATRPDLVAEFSLSGVLSPDNPLETWWASVLIERGRARSMLRPIWRQTGRNLEATGFRKSYLSGVGSAGCNVG